MAQLSPEDRVFVNADFLNTTHGQLSCTACHNGNSKTDLTEESKTEAHAESDDFVAHPSAQADKFCAGCHANIVSQFAKSLHYTQEGYYQRFMVRSGGSDLRNDPEMKAGFGRDCGKCHATCGECHVIRPDLSVGILSGVRLI